MCRDQLKNTQHSAIHTLNVSTLIETAHFGERLQRPIELMLGYILDDNIPITSNGLDCIHRHLDEISKVDDEKNGGARLHSKTSCRGEMMAWSSRDIVGLDEMLDTVENLIFLTSLDVMVLVQCNARK
jgi:hypothetical protein